MMLLQPRTQEALRALPSAGWVGRRDRAVLVLSQMAGMSDEDIAGLTVGDVVIADGAATITAATGTITLPASDDGMICGPCALVARAGLDQSEHRRGLFVHAVEVAILADGNQAEKAGRRRRIQSASDP